MCKKSVIYFKNINMKKKTYGYVLLSI